MRKSPWFRLAWIDVAGRLLVGRTDPDDDDNGEESPDFPGSTPPPPPPGGP